MKPIPYGRQDINESDIQAVVDVLRSDWLTQGPAIERFERTVADYCGAKYAVAVSNATAALHIACLAAGLGPGDTLWTSPNTFVASANCGRYCGAAVDFVDIDPRSYNLSPEALGDKLEAAHRRGRLPKVLVPVHFAGQSCEMAPISELARSYGLTIIEDAAHAIGGQYRGRPVGACVYSDMTVFSFHPVKIVTSGEGGMVLTNRRDLYERLIRLRSHGITRDPVLMQGEFHGPWYYQQIDLGFNYRLTDIQAALGASQMNRLDEFVARRNCLAERYSRLLSEFPVRVPRTHPEVHSSFHLYVIRLKPDRLKITHREVFERLRASGIEVGLHYIPVHTQPYYQALGFSWGNFPEAEAYYSEAISLPMFYGLSESQQDCIVGTLESILG